MSRRKAPPPAPPPEPPGDLKPAAADRWRAVVPALVRRGAVDLETLRSYCQLWARWREAEDTIQKAGQVVQNPSGRVVASPMIGIANQTAGQVRALEDKLGIGLPEEEATAPARARGSAAWRKVNRVQLAELLGVHPDRVTHYARQGMPVEVAGGRGRESTYDAVACLTWWRDKNTDGKDAAQARALNASAELNELKLEEAKRNLVPRAQVITEGKAYTMAWSKKVRSLPRRLVQQGVIPRDKEAAAAEVCADVLRDIASWKTIADISEPEAEAV